MSVLRRPAWAAVTVAGLALVVAAGLTAPHLLGGSLRPAADASGLHSHRASAQPSLQGGAAPVSNTTAGFTRLRFHHRRTHATTQPTAAAQAPSSSTANGPVTQGTDCVASPHSCGFPDATNTGADCSSLSPSGSITVTSDGAVVEGKNISGSITVQASNVTLVAETPGSVANSGRTRLSA